MRLLGPPSAARSWAFFGLYLAGIYASLPFVRGVAIALRQKHMFGATVTFLYFASVVALVYYVIFDVHLSDRIAFFALVLLAAATGSLVLGLSVPEEQIHFLEYGILALLARRALSWRCRPRGQYGGAWLLASGAGIVDEIIQIPLPMRFFGVRDVVMNSIGALLALAIDEVLHDRLGWLPRKVGDETNPDRR